VFKINGDRDLCLSQDMLVLCELQQRFLKPFHGLTDNFIEIMLTDVVGSRQSKSRRRKCSIRLLYRLGVTLGPSGVELSHQSDFDVYNTLVMMLMLFN